MYHGKKARCDNKVTPSHQVLCESALGRYILVETEGKRSIVAYTHGRDWRGLSSRCPTNLDMIEDEDFLSFLAQVPADVQYITINFAEYETRSNPADACATEFFMVVWKECHAHCQLFIKTIQALASSQEDHPAFLQALAAISLDVCAT